MSPGGIIGFHQAHNVDGNAVIWVNRAVTRYLESKGYSTEVQRHSGRAPGVSQAGTAQGRRREADDPGADRDAVRSRPGQPARPHEHGRRAARIRRRARGPADRREAVPGDMRHPANCRYQGCSRATAMRLLPVEPAWRLADRAEEQRWLVTSLWSEQAVGIIGGEPKCCKSFLALDLALAVPAGVPCLAAFAV